MDAQSEGNNQRSLEDWIVSVKEELDRMKSITRNEEPPPPPNGRKSTIYRLPAYLREKLPAHLSEKLPTYHWVPRLLELGPERGPYHVSDPSLPAILIQRHVKEDIKRRAFLYFLNRSNKPLNVYVEALHDVVQDLKDAYDGYDELARYNRLENDDDFLILMICDGCVLVEILRELSKVKDYQRNYNSDHPLRNVEGISHGELIEHYEYDILLFENQLPMLLLQRLLAVETDCETDALYKEYILTIFWPFRLFDGIQCQHKFLHVLDLYRHILFYQGHCGHFGMDRNPELTTMHPGFNFNIPSVTDLKDAGIRITMSETTSLMDISIQRGNLMLPQFFFDGATKLKFINIIAFERLLDDAYEVTSYIYFMSSLLRDANDVRILRSSGIIRTGRLHNDEVAEMFKSLTKDIIMRDPRTFFNPAYREVSKHLIEAFDKKNKEWKKDLWQNYLRSPWAIVSLVIAFFLFALTIVQTVYTVLGHYKSK